MEFSLATPAFIQRHVFEAFLREAPDLIEVVRVGNEDAISIVQQSISLHRGYNSETRDR